MKLVRIINGSYGYRPAGSKYIEPKQAGDPPFEIEDDKAERLVSIGVAEYASKLLTTTDMTEKETAKVVATTLEDANGQDASTKQLQQDDGSKDAKLAQDKPEYNIDMKASELRELMEDCDLAYKVGMSKADMVAALDAYFEDEAEDENTEGLPNLGAEEPVV